MGASEWIYYVPYRANIEQAFQILRQQVFESKQFHNWAEILEYEQMKETLCIEQGMDIWSIIHRWMGYYDVIYQNELPCEIVFAGCSGD